MPRNPLWTPQQIETLRQSAADGLFCREAALRTGRSFKACQAKAKTLGISFRGQVQNERRGQIMKKPDAASIARMRAGLLAAGDEAQRRRAAAISQTRRAAYGIAGFSDASMTYYRKLRGQGFRAPEAAAIVKGELARQIVHALRQIAAVAKPLADEQRRQHNSFEAQLERIRNGQARVVPALRMSRPVGTERSLIGNATGMCA